MDRKELVTKAYDHAASLGVDDPIYRKRVQAFTTDLMNEDTRETGDITTQTVLNGLNPPTSARLIAKETGICAGLEEAAWFFRQCGITVTTLKKDGDRVEKGDILISLNGNCHQLLVAERVGLNLTQRMSGIATQVHALQNLISETPVKIAATRKTPYGLLDNKAVSIGGGLTHRLGLWHSVLIKENHLAVLQQNGFENNYIEEALTRAWQNDKTRVVEIEVQTEAETERAVKQFKNLFHQTPRDVIGVILLDNFAPEALRSFLDQMKSQALNIPLLFEASGNITPQNLVRYANTPVDVISMGFLTHSPKAFDISQLHDI